MPTKTNDQVTLGQVISQPKQNKSSFFDYG